jgi:hypothetical protein
VKCCTASNYFAFPFSDSSIDSIKHSSVAAKAAGQLLERRFSFSRCPEFRGDGRRRVSHCSIRSQPSAVRRQESSVWAAVIWGPATDTK